MSFPNKEKVAWAKEKAPYFVRELRDNNVDLWIQYTREEIEVGAISWETSGPMKDIVNALFPGSTLSDVTYIMIETRSLVRAMLNLPASPLDER
ncbi:hypothetical protein ACETRX_36835 [Labrys portucalensis]|uniref:Uncharacterized protein n=1 Tax=Labrys neptuniae TaxID=376174 RepID=A0ABV6ZSJ2_9HYPH